MAAKRLLETIPIEEIFSCGRNAGLSNRYVARIMRLAYLAPESHRRSWTAPSPAASLSAGYLPVSPTPGPSNAQPLVFSAADGHRSH